MCVCTHTHESMREYVHARMSLVMYVCVHVCVVCVHVCVVCVHVSCVCVRVCMVSVYVLIVCLSKWLCVCVCLFRFAVGEQVEVFVDAVKRRLHARYIKVNMISLIVITRQY